MIRKLQDRLSISKKQLRKLGLIALMTAMPMHLLTSSKATVTLPTETVKESAEELPLFESDLLTLEEKEDTSYGPIRKVYVGTKRYHGTRSQTLFIVWHVTNGGYVGSKGELYKRGKGHYMTTLWGTLEKYVHPDAIANHAGESYFNGIDHVSRYSVGIENVTNSEFTVPVGKQRPVLKEGTRQVQTRYRLGDVAVVTHTQIAVTMIDGKMYRHYRKKCGIAMMSAQWREMMGIGPTYQSDPDVLSGKVFLGPTTEDSLIHAIAYPYAPYLQSFLAQEHIKPVMIALNNSLDSMYAEKNFTPLDNIIEAYDPTTRFFDD